MGSYNYKNILLGMGIGMVAAAIINISTGTREMTVEEIKREAAKHNLIVLTKEEILNTGHTPATEAPEPTAIPSQAPGTDEAPPSSELVSVKIETGMTSESIADLLKEKGLIEDSKAFQERLSELKVENRLRTGEYKIPKSASNDEIIKILTK